MSFDDNHNQGKVVGDAIFARLDRADGKVARVLLDLVVVPEEVGDRITSLYSTMDESKNYEVKEKVLQLLNSELGIELTSIRNDVHRGMIERATRSLERALLFNRAIDEVLHDG